MIPTKYLEQRCMTCNGHGWRYTHQYGFGGFGVLACQSCKGTGYANGNIPDYVMPQAIEPTANAQAEGGI